jgi:hypothetical protein
MNNNKIDERNKAYLAETYERVGLLYKRVSFFGFDEIKRCYPIFFKKYFDIEEEIDKNGHNFDFNFMKHMCENMVAVWQNLVAKIETDIENKIKKGMPRPVSNARYSGLAIYREDCYMNSMVEVGYCTPQEIKNWLDKKVTIAELQEINRQQFDKSLNRRFNNSFMIYCEMSDDSVLNKSFVQEEKLEEKPLEIVKSYPKKEIAFDELEVIEEVLNIEVKEGWI